MTHRDRPKPSRPGADSGISETQRDYRRLLFFAVLTVSLVSIVPLLIMTAVNYVQYQQALRTELSAPISRMTRTAKHSLEFFLSERQSALRLAVSMEPLENLANPEWLDELLVNMTMAFGGFIDLGLVAADGQHISYAGPYDLEGVNYADQEWFNEVWDRGGYTSDVFLGHRDVPHFVIAVRHDTADEGSYVLRATIDTETIVEQVLHREDAPFADVFLVNRDGILQTPSRLYGDVLGHCPLQVPPYFSGIQLVETHYDRGEPLIVGFSYVVHSPFTVVLVSREAELGDSWLSLRRNLLLFLFVSMALILAVVVWGSVSMISRIRESDLKRTSLLHQMEYTNKMAAIGRLASGVAHEINNPLAIINEKTGLSRDLLTLKDELPPKERLLELFDSVLHSVQRCSRITHRLLGFAKHLDGEPEQLDLQQLLRNIFGFLEQEAAHRNLHVTFEFEQELPSVLSDAGLLQQVFLNILNNAFAAVGDGGQIRITGEQREDNGVAVSIRDNGSGICEEDQKHIFEPFFSTKGAAGTGLGLSITYGIVNKLGGRIEVESAVGEGTKFTVILPTGT